MNIVFLSQILYNLDKITAWREKDMTIEVLLEYIKRYPVEEYYFTEEHAEIFQAKCYQKDTEIKSYDRSTIFLSNENCDSRYATNYIRFAADTDVEQIITDVDRFIYEQTETFQKEGALRLFQYLTTENSLDALMDMAFELLQNPIIYYDSLHNVVKHRESKTISNAGWLREIELGHHDFSQVDDKFYANLKVVTKTKDIMVNLFDGERCIGGSIMRRNSFFGALGVLENYRQFRSYDEKIIRYIADVIAVKNNELAAGSQKDDYTYADLLRELLKGKIQSRQLLTELLHSRRWNVKKYNRIYVISGESDAYMSYLQKYIQSMGQNKVIQYEENLVILAEKEKPEESIFMDFPAMEQVVVGVSDIFDDLYYVKNYYRQAKKAIEYGSVLEQGKRKYYYTEYRFIDLVSKIKSTEEFYSFLHPVVLEISKYDREHHSHYFITLLTYLAHGKSIERSCTELELHKNTVQYRINKIKELFGIDFEDEEQLFDISLSLKMLYWAEKLPAPVLK